jgi:hypothetical protein
MILSLGHASVGASPEPPGYKAQAAMLVAREAAIAAIKTLDASQPDRSIATLARALGLV